MQLTNKNYFSKEANMHYMSVSQVKDMMTCEARALAKIKGEWDNEKSDPLLIGGYIDAYFSGELKEFQVENPELFKKDGTLYAKYEVCNQVIQAIENDEFLLQFFKGITQIIETGEIHGIPFKIKIDCLNEFGLIDWKIMRDFNDIWSKSAKKYLPFFQSWQYDLQLAIYQEVHLQNCGEVSPTYIASASKETITDKIILKFKQDTLAQVFNDIVTADRIQRMDAVKKELVAPIPCECCDYCKSVKKLTTFDIKEV